MSRELSKTAEKAQPVPKSLLRLFWEMFIISACTFGGGYVIVAFIQEKFVEKLKWLTEDEMLNLLSAAQSAPGPVATNTAVMTGYRIYGAAGAAAAVTAAALPPLLIMILAASFFDKLNDISICQTFFKYAKTAIAAISIHVSWNMAVTVKNKLGAASLAIGALISLTMIFFKFNTAYYVAFGAALGLIMYSGKKTDKGSTAAAKANEQK